MPPAVSRRSSAAGVLIRFLDGERMACGRGEDLRILIRAFDRLRRRPRRHESRRETARILVGLLDRRRPCLRPAQDRRTGRRGVVFLELEEERRGFAVCDCGHGSSMPDRNGFANTGAPVISGHRAARLRRVECERARQHATGRITRNSTASQEEASASARWPTRPPLSPQRSVGPGKRHEDAAERDLLIHCHPRESLPGGRPHGRDSIARPDY